MKIKKTISLAFLFFVCITFLAGCADPNPLKGVKDAEGDIAGFWAGLVHGYIAPFTLIGSVFSKKITMYAVNNSGVLYNFGFLAGFIFLLVTCASDTEEEGGGGGGRDQSDPDEPPPTRKKKHHKKIRLGGRIRFDRDKMHLN